MATLSGSVINISAGVRGFDTATTLTSTSAVSLKNNGYSFALRYVSRSTPEPSGDLSSGEANKILDAGLGLMIVQHVAAAGWKPSASLGTQYGTNCATNCTSVGIPKSVSVWCDLEGVDTSVDAQDIIDYCNNWWNAVFMLVMKKPASMSDPVVDYGFGSDD